MHQLITVSETDFENAIEHLQQELQTIRGNRAHPSLVENIKVSAYGSEMRLQELASVSVPEPRTIQVQPWDKGLLKDIERALGQAELNVSITNDGQLLHLTLPSLTQETRNSLLKVLGQKLEQGRVQVRQAREKTREAINKAEKAKEITEDDRFQAQKELDEFTRSYLDKIDGIGERKEKEITTI
ncbi:MAG: ribosome recycling factor [Patescibacteria group bacterium]|jgi:ribosome recycling factor